MKAAIVLEAGKDPVYGDFPEPAPGENLSKIKVTASALSNLTKGRAAGTHYSSSASFPFVAGVDGVGRLEDGRRVYFFLPEAPFGSMAEFSAAKASHCIALPDGLDDVSAAALANPGMSCWAALKERAKLAKGEVVLVNGATGVAGSLAVQVAKFMGAKKVIATGRNPTALKLAGDLGADVTISLNQEADALEEAFKGQFSGDGVDVVLDYLWGASAERLLVAGAKAGREAVPIRFVQIGSASGADLTLAGAVLRSSSIELMGSGIGSVPFDRLAAAVSGVFQAAGPGQFKILIRSVPVAQVGQTWNEKNESRTVFTIGDGTAG